MLRLLSHQGRGAQRHLTKRTTPSITTHRNSTSPRNDFSELLRLLGETDLSTKAAGKNARPGEMKSASGPFLSRTNPVQRERKGHAIDQTPIQKDVCEKLNFEQLPRLAHGLETTIFNPGIHLLRDELNNFRFSPFLWKIHQPEEIDYDNLAPFVPPSGDKKLHKMGAMQECKYVASTSSMTTILSYLYSLFSDFKTPNISIFSEPFQAKKNRPRIPKPRSIFIRKTEQGLFAVDNNSGTKFPQNKILLDLGKSLERMLTMNPQDFSATMLKSSPDKRRPSPEVFHYLKLENSMVVRSQLDCYMPEQGFTFDLKTRATIAIRIQPQNFKKMAGYEISHLTGLHHSFERELYDMVRSTFLKYLFQVKLGEMGGIFVAYHNTQELLAFEFFTREMMENIVFGSTQFAEISFTICNKLLLRLLDEVRSLYPNRDNLKITFAPNMAKELDVFIEELKSPQDVGLGTVPSAFQSPSSYKDLPVTWLKMKIAHYLNDKHVYTLGNPKPTDFVSLDVQFERVKNVSHSQVVTNYIDFLARSQLYEETVPGKVW